MTLEEASKFGNEAAAQVLRQILDVVGPGTRYRTIVGAMATSLLFHAFRLELPGSAKAIEMLQAILGDVALNVKTLSGRKIRFTVSEEP
jgi:hypothetical protein